MEKEKKLMTYIVLLILLNIWTSLMWLKEVNFAPVKQVTLDSLQKANDSLVVVSDSLYMENFPCQIELNRYKIAYEIFIERNPKAASQFSDIISNETE